MLLELRIQNYAIIEELEIRFDPSLTIITGETGAGKSILMGALSLILGERADYGAMLNREKKCFVEGLFKIEGRTLVLGFLEENDLDQETELLIRREISPGGKSRAFINDTPVSLSQLQQLALLLVDLHRQFDTLTLGESLFQLSVLDTLAGNEEQLAAYSHIFRQWQGIQQQLTALEERKSVESREFDFNSFLFKELEEAAFKENELEEIEAELKLLTDAEGIKLVLSGIADQVRNGEHPVAGVLKQLVQQLQPYAQHHTQVMGICERLKATQIELNDIGTDAEHLADQIGYDEEKINQLNERLNMGNRLLKKHNVQHTSQLLAIRLDLEVRLVHVTRLDDAIEGLQRELKDAFNKLQDISVSLRKARQKQMVPFEKKVNELLARVGMPNARIKVDLQPSTPGRQGADMVEFLFDANKSGQFTSLRKVASGGELSRLMLCIKSLVAEKLDLPTLIFDEIDSGISGEASRQVGLIMKELAVSRQVICITHQPQIAGKASLHLFVYKQESGKSIRTHIRPLDKEERIRAIARMLSGDAPTAAALENAREMVAN